MRDLFRKKGEMHSSIKGAAVAAALAFVSAAAFAQQGPKSGFAKPPAEALKALKASVGKPFKTGWVFIEGRYIPPPYKVERWGNVIRINGIQATDEIVPWGEFVKTQDGATATRTEIPAEAEPVAESAPQPEPEEDFDDISLDDLFDDAPSPKKKKPVRRAAPKPRPRKPQVVVTYSMDGDFTPNEKSKAYVAGINKERTRIDKTLRMGGYYFFGPGYRFATGDSGAAAQLMPKLAAAMKSAASREGFGAACNAAGIGYLPHGLLDELYRARVGYIQIDSRLREEEERRKWFGGAGGL